MYKDVKEFFEKNLTVSIDEKLLDQLRKFRLGWSTKSEEYIDFLGSNLIGNHVIRFSVEDEYKLMNDIYNVSDLVEFQKEFYKVRGINKDFKVASNVIYHTLVYTAAVYAKRYYRKNKKMFEMGIREPILILQYKMFTSLYFHYFKYRVSDNIAVTVFEKLSYKFILKQVGSWGNMFLYRVNQILENEDGNLTRLLKYNTENAIRIIIDIQTKLRSSLISIYTVLVDVVEKNDIIKQNESTFVGGENEEKQVADISSNIEKYIIKAKDIYNNCSSFYRKDLVDILIVMYEKLKPELIEKFLSNICKERILKETKIPKNKFDIKTYDDLIERILIISFSYLQRLNINIKDKANIPLALVYIKNYWSSSKSETEEMRFIKNEILKLAYIITKKKTKWVLALLVLIYINYLFLRSLDLD